ncbi:hypothetical protein ElyMa_002241200 [Elysia marginata]|uniref:Spondin domain-containing protein n=1 Tax=Elysia marginata TaxID=1093978 RepID=A0AAV4FXE9_9GAST|nr:hypothetical protein ElyMa_002241200 [Elysia marginata]
MSASSKSKTSKRHRNDSEISVTTESPEVAGRETQTGWSKCSSVGQCKSLCELPFSLLLKEEDDPQFQLWQTDWDNWVKPQEDLTLTPRSGDLDLSPTSSNFLFPPASSTASQEVAKASRSEEQKSSQTSAPTPTAEKDFDSSLCAVTAPKSITATSFASSSSSSSSSAVGGVVSSSLPDSASKPSVRTFSSQQYSLSSTPPKASTVISMAGTTSTSPKPGVDSSTAVDSTQGQPTESQAVSSEVESRPSSTDFPLAINTSQAMSINTSNAPAPSPSSSSLSSLPMNTPPMMLSPAAGTAEVPPLTPVGELGAQ